MPGRKFKDNKYKDKFGWPTRSISCGSLLHCEEEIDNKRQTSDTCAQTFGLIISNKVNAIKDNQNTCKEIADAEDEISIEDDSLMQSDNFKKSKFDNEGTKHGCLSTVKTSEESTFKVLFQLKKRHEEMHSVQPMGMSIRNNGSGPMLQCSGIQNHLTIKKLGDLTLEMTNENNSDKILLKDYERQLSALRMQFEKERLLRIEKEKSLETVLHNHAFLEKASSDKKDEQLQQLKTLIEKMALQHRQELQELKYEYEEKIRALQEKMATCVSANLFTHQLNHGLTERDHTLENCTDEVADTTQEKLKSANNAGDKLQTKDEAMSKTSRDQESLKIESLKQKHISQIQKLEVMYENEIAALDQQFENFKQTNEIEVEKINSDYKKKLEQFNLQKETELQKMKEKHLDIVNQMQSSHKIEVEDVKLQLQDSLEIQAQNKTLIQELQKRCGALEKIIEEKADARILTEDVLIEKSHELTMFQAENESLQKDLQESKARLQEVRQNFRTRLERLQNQHEKVIDHIHEDMKEEMESVQISHEQQLQKTKTAYQEQIKTLRQKHTEKFSTLKQEYKKLLETPISSKKEKLLQSKVEQLQADLRSCQDKKDKVEVNFNDAHRELEMVEFALTKGTEALLKDGIPPATCQQFIVSLKKIMTEMDSTEVVAPTLHSALSDIQKYLNSNVDKITAKYEHMLQCRQKQIDELSIKLSKAEQKAAERQQAVEEIHTLFQEKASQLEEKERKLKKMSEDLKMYKIRDKQMRAKEQELLEDSKQKDVLIQNEQSEKEILKKERDAMFMKYKEKGQDLTEAQLDIKQLEEERNALKNQVDEIYLCVEEEQALLAQLRVEFEVLTQERVDLQKEVMNLRKSIADLNIQIDEQKVAIKGLELQVTSLESEKAKCTGPPDSAPQMKPLKRERISSASRNQGDGYGKHQEVRHLPDNSELKKQAMIIIESLKAELEEAQKKLKVHEKREEEMKETLTEASEHLANLHLKNQMLVAMQNKTAQVEKVTQSTQTSSYKEEKSENFQQMQRDKSEDYNWRQKHIPSHVADWLAEGSGFSSSQDTDIPPSPIREAVRKKILPEHSLEYRAETLKLMRQANKSFSKELERIKCDAQWDMIPTSMEDN